MKRLLCLWLLLVLSAVCWAQTPEMSTGKVTVRFTVDPPDAEVIPEGRAVDVGNDEAKPIGKANTPIVFERADYPKGRLILVFRAPGYEDLRREFSLSNNWALEEIDVPVDDEPIVLVKKSRFRLIMAGVLVAMAGAAGAAFRYKTVKGQTRDIARWVAESTVKSDDLDTL